MVYIPNYTFLFKEVGTYAFQHFGKLILSRSKSIIIHHMCKRIKTLSNSARAMQNNSYNGILRANRVNGTQVFFVAHFLTVSSLCFNCLVELDENYLQIIIITLRM